MNNEFMKTDFVADAVAAYMTNGYLPTADLAAYVDRMPLIVSLRERMSEDDIPRLIKAIEEESGETAGLAVSLLRRYVSDQRVKDCLAARWDTADVYLKSRIMWRLMDDPELPASWHRRIYEFVLAEWRTFAEFNQTFYGQGKEGVSNLLARLGSLEFPSTKKWVYLCAVPVILNNNDAARGVLEFGLTLNDQFAKEVAGELLQRLAAGDFDRLLAPLVPRGNAENLFLDLAADAIIFHIRKGHQPKDNDSDRLNQVPLIDALRSRITADDLPWIMAVIEVESGSLAAFYLSLIKNFDTQSDIREILRHRWETATPYLRAHLMWRILDDPQLPEEWHRAVFNFVIAEWETFSEVVRKFLGGPQSVIPNVLRRLGDASYPESKKWINFCRLPEIAEDQEAAKALVNLGRLMPDPFCKEVAEVLLQRFFEVHQRRARA
jgi:hypothetical protein